MTRLANAYFTSRAIVCHALHRTTDGVWIGGEPYLRLAADATDGALGEAARAALLASSVDVPHPSTWAGATRALVDAAGARSYGALVRDSRRCEIAESAGTLVITPTSNGGATGPGRGFEPLPDQSESLDAPAPAGALGAAIRRAGERCTRRCQ